MQIANNHLTLTVAHRGAEPVSLRAGDREYLWQGNPAYWKRHAPILFPIVGKVFDNANNILPYWLKKALFNDKHNLHKELLEPADVVLMHGEIPKTLMTVVDKNGCFYIGYYQQKAYITEKYGTAIGKEEVTIEHHTPEHIDVPTDIDNTIDDLKR
jgi:hypothetical protein